MVELPVLLKVGSVTGNLHTPLRHLVLWYPSQEVAAVELRDVFCGHVIEDGVAILPHHKTLTVTQDNNLKLTEPCHRQKQKKGLEMVSTCKF